MPSDYQRVKGYLDREFSLLIRLRDSIRFHGVCPLCGERPIEECFHFFPRKWLAVRWNMDNAVGSCAWCNREEAARRHTPESDAKFSLLHAKLSGAIIRLWVEQHHRDSVKFTTAELKEMLAEVRANLGALKKIQEEHHDPILESLPRSWNPGRRPTGTSEALR